MNEDKTIVIDISEAKETAKTKAEKAKEWASTKLREGADWVHNHKEEAVWIAIGVGAGVKMIYSLHKRALKNAELKWCETHIFDPSTRRCVQTKKPVKGKDAIKFSAMRRAGYTVTEALEAMRLLKY